MVPTGPPLSISLVLVSAPEDPRVADGSGDWHQGPASGPGVGRQAGGGDSRREVVPKAGDLPPQVRVAPSPYVQRLPGLCFCSVDGHGGWGEPCCPEGPPWPAEPKVEPRARRPAACLPQKSRIPNPLPLGCYDIWKRKPVITPSLRAALGNLSSSWRHSLWSGGYKRWGGDEIGRPSLSSSLGPDPLPDLSPLLSKQQQPRSDRSHRLHRPHSFV